MPTPDMSTLGIWRCLIVDKQCIFVLVIVKGFFFKDRSSEDGELLVVDRDNQEDNALFYVRCIAPKVQGIRNFSFKLNVLSTTTLNCTRPLFNRVHSVSKLGCFPCSQEHGLCNQQILLCINRWSRLCFLNFSSILQLLMLNERYIISHEFYLE